LEKIESVSPYSTGDFVPLGIRCNARKSTRFEAGVNAHICFLVRPEHDAALRVWGNVERPSANGQM
jgi:hypothetical protein